MRIKKLLVRRRKPKGIALRKTVKKMLGTCPKDYDERIDVCRKGFANTQTLQKIQISTRYREEVSTSLFLVPSSITRRENVDVSSVSTHFQRLLMITVGNHIKRPLCDVFVVIIMYGMLVKLCQVKRRSTTTH